MDISLSFDVFDEVVEYRPSPVERETLHHEFDELVRLAACVTGTRRAVITLIDDGRQRFAARHGVTSEDMPIATAFCGRVPAVQDILIIADATGDPGFREDSSATGEGGFRFCAGIPLRLASGHCIGSLCVFDPAPREGLSRLQLTAFHHLARIGTELILSRRFRRTGEIAIQAIENDHRDVRAFLDTVIANLPIGVSVKDSRTGEYLLINRAGEQLFGRPAEQIVGRTITELVPEQGERHEMRDAQVVAAGSPLTSESAGTRADGSIFQLRTKRIVIDGPERPRQYIVSLSDDVTDIRRAEAAACLDRLTGLINRTAYIDRLTRLVEAKTPIALLKVDLARFRSINDQFGHPLGDKMLTQVAGRLRLAVGPADLVARVGGNEFVLLLIGNRPVDRAQPLADFLVDCLAEPFLIDHVTVHGGACIGIAMSPDHAGTVDEFRRSAELALHRAKQQGRGGICSFDADIDVAARDRQMLENDLRDALDAGDIVPAYQPVMSVATGRMSSVEALARWTHPIRGPIGPDIFISLAEECGLVHRLGEQILRRACLDAMAWPDYLRVAVNLSPLQFEHGDLYATIRAVLAESGLAANRLQLEVTEGLLIRDVERTFVELERLRALGIHILMDDFGVGYSSLSYFERLPFDMVKIDKSFIDGIGTSLSAKAIIKAVVGLGQDLDMGIVAEGVETEEQAQLLFAAGCTHLQGYFFSRPLPATAITAMAAPTDDDCSEFARAA